MGLDMYVFRITKPNLEYKLYSQDELDTLRLTTCAVSEFERIGEAMRQLSPYVSKIQVVNKYYNLEQIIKDYRLPANSYIGMYSSAGITVSGRDDEGKRVSAEISPEEIDSKYTLCKTEDSYAWKSEEVAYWRKHYSLQERFYDLIGDVENCGYYKLDRLLIAQLREEFREDVEDIPLEDSTEESALFYHEWY